MIIKPTPVKFDVEMTLLELQCLKALLGNMSNTDFSQYEVEEDEQHQALEDMYNTIESTL